MLAWQLLLMLVLPAAVALALLGLLDARISTDTVPLQAASLAWLVAWPACSAALAWAGRQVWRAAQAFAAAGGAPLWRWATQAGVAVVGLLWLAVLVLATLPQAAERLQWAQGNDATGRVQLLPAANGRRLRLEGSIGLGDGERVVARLAAMPQLQLLELQGSGTRLGEARRMARAVRERGLQTRMVGPCENACVLVFLAGGGRQMMAGAQLLLNRPRTHALDPLGSAIARRMWAQEWRQAGLPADFIQRGLRAPPGQPWSPDESHLMASALLGDPDRPLDVALPVGPGVLADDHAQALRSHWLWRALEARFPGSIDMAAERMAAGNAAGAGADALQLAAQSVVQAALPGLLAASDSLVLEQFTALLTDQLTAAQAAGDAACTGVLQADAAARRALPPALRVREAAWLKDALASAPPDRPARRRGDLEREVMRRTLGDRAPARLAGLWGPRRNAAADPGCQQAAQLLAMANSLPASERKLAARMMFLPP